MINFGGIIDQNCKQRYLLPIKIVRIHLKIFKEIMDSNQRLVTFLSFESKLLIFNMSQILFSKWVGKAKILRNIQDRLDEMLIIAYIVGGWVQKSPKKCLRNIWTVPQDLGWEIGLKSSLQCVLSNSKEMLTYQRESNQCVQYVTRGFATNLHSTPT